MKIRTSQLTGPALDWAVGRANGGIRTQQVKAHGPVHVVRMSGACDPLPYRPSADPALAWPIIHSEQISIEAPALIAREVGTRASISYWNAVAPDGTGMMGPNGLIAAMRCFVLTRLGSEVDVPDELVEA